MMAALRWGQACSEWFPLSGLLPAISKPTDSLSLEHNYYYRLRSSDVTHPPGHGAKQMPPVWMHIWMNTWMVGSLG